MIIQEATTGPVKLSSRGKAHFWSYVLFFAVLALTVFYATNYNARRQKAVQDQIFCAEMGKIFTSPVEMRDGYCAFSEDSE